MADSDAGSIRIEPGQVLITEGEPGTHMYLIEEGRVEILKRSPAGEERLLRVLEAGDFFGETALLDGGIHNVSARAVTDGRLIAIEPETLTHMLREYPEVAVRMLRVLARRLGEMDAAAAARANPVDRRKTRKRPSPASAGSGASGGRAGEARLVHKLSETILPLPRKDDVQIGRYDSLTGVCPDVDLTALDLGSSTSRSHARILREDGKLFLCEEPGVANGTFRNGTRIAAGARVEIQDGDELRFGDVVMLVRTA